MAQYHAHGSISHNACLTFAYDCRDEIIDPNTGKKANYKYKEDLLYANSFMAEYAPQAWTENPVLCWLSVAENEGKITANGKQAQHARKVEFALPKELSQEKAIEACDEFAKSMQEKGMCVSYGLHKTPSGNIHCHCMMTLRKLDKKGNWEKNKFKSQYVYEQKKDENGKPMFEDVPVYEEDKNKLDENGKPQKVQKLDKNGEPEYEKKPVYVLDENGKPKKIPQLDENGQQKFRERPGKGKEMLWVREVVDVNEWNDCEWYKTNVRKKIETICNDKLKEIGSTERVDCRSYKERGINKTPTIHEGCYSDTAVRQLFNKQIRERNQKEESWEQLAAELKERIAAEAVNAEPIIDINVSPAVSPSQPEDKAADLTPERQEQPERQPVIQEESETLEIPVAVEKVTVENAPTSAEVEPKGIKVPPETEKKAADAHQSDVEEKDLPEIPAAAEIESAPECEPLDEKLYEYVVVAYDKYDFITTINISIEPEPHSGGLPKPEINELDDDGNYERVTFFETREEAEDFSADMMDKFNEQKYKFELFKQENQIRQFRKAVYLAESKTGEDGRSYFDIQIWEEDNKDATFLHPLPEIQDMFYEKLPKYQGKPSADTEYTMEIRSDDDGGGGFSVGRCVRQREKEKSL